MSTDTHEYLNQSAFPKGETKERSVLCSCLCRAVGQKRRLPLHFKQGVPASSYLILLTQRSWTSGSEEVFFIKVFVFNVYGLFLSLLLVFKNDSSELFDIYPTHKVKAGNRVNSFLVTPLHSVKHAGGSGSDQGTREHSPASSPSRRLCCCYILNP